MMEKEKIKNISFFKKVWYSITKFEKYPEMAKEGIGRAFQYLLILSIIISIFSSISLTIMMKNTVESIADYIEEKMPEFSYLDGNIQMYSEEPIIIKDIDISGIDKIIINSTIENEQDKELFEEENKIEDGVIIYFFKNEITVKTMAEGNQISLNSYTYKDCIEIFAGEEINSFSKTELIEYMKASKMNDFYKKYAISEFVYWLLVQIIVMLVDALEIAVFGVLTEVIAGVKMRFRAIYNMAIYSLTLPVILNIIYIIINYFITFEIKYFDVAYMTIAYIYLAAVIFILKDDFIKKMQEVQEIRKIQKEVKEINEKDEENKPLEEPQDNSNDDEPKNDEEKNKKQEPDGSEA